MELSLAVARPDGSDRHLVVACETSSSVQEVAQALAPWAGVQGTAPYQLRSLDRDVVFDAGLHFGSCGIVSGELVSVEVPKSRSAPRPLLGLCVTKGPERGKCFRLGQGHFLVGRSSTCSIRIEDPTVSREHVKVGVLGPDSFSIHPVSSTNVIELDGQEVDSATQAAGPHRLQIGDCEVSLYPFGRRHGVRSNDGYKLHTPSPRVTAAPHISEVHWPNPPAPARPQRLPLIASLVPLLIAAVTFILTRNAMSLLFAFLSPVMAVASHFESRRHGKKEHSELVREWNRECSRLKNHLNVLAIDERKRLEHLYPSSEQLLLLSQAASLRIWERQRGQLDCLQLRIGRGTVTTPWTLKPPTSGASELVEQAARDLEKYHELDHVPVRLDLENHGNIVFRFSKQWEEKVKDYYALESAAAALIVQGASVLSPADLVLATCLHPAMVQRWDWLKWLPHTQASDVLPAPLLACDAISIGVMAAALVDMLSKREAATRNDQNGQQWPHILVLVDLGNEPIPSNLLEISRAARPRLGVTLVFVDRQGHGMSPAVSAVVSLKTSQTAMLSFPASGEHVDLTLDPLSVGQCEMAARLLASLKDPRVHKSGDTLLPSAVSLTDLVGFRTRDEPATVIRNWNVTRSVLQSVIGQTSAGHLSIDLRTDGPHGLVAGTTGAGKSEFLQALVASFAARHSPRRLNFLLVDYKGGAAFKDCRDLIHTVGLVTDLDGHLVARVLTSLRAELHYRERLLASRNARDIVQMEQETPSLAPPNLLIIVDEFAALSREIPEFVEGMVDVAQRGRSLGIHMLLATQRPAGVVTDNIRANTNLRIALRVSDAAESNDVIGSPIAASFDRRIPGRGAIRIGPSELIPFQSAYVGGRSTVKQALAGVRVRPLRMDAAVDAYLAAGGSDDREHARQDTPTDLVRFVATINEAARTQQTFELRKPWLPELPPVVDLQALLSEGFQPGELIVGLADDPSQQRQEPCSINLAVIGNLLVCGTSGAGKTYFLRSLAAAAGLQTTEELHVYGLDCSGQGLRILQSLPHVGSIISATDIELTTRLLRTLRGMVDARRELLGEFAASDLVELRTSSEDLQFLPRVVVLIDGIHAFLENYERVDSGVWIDELAQLLADGRAAGVHFILSADRRGGIPMKFVSQMPEPLTLKLASPDEYMAAGVKPAALGDSPPPGRALYRGLEVQLATPSAAISGSDQAKAFETLGRQLQDTGRGSAPSIRKLPNEVGIDDLPPGSIGLSGTDLTSVHVPSWELAGVFGPSRSGRTSALMAFAEASLAVSPTRSVIFLSASVRDMPLPPWVLGYGAGPEQGAGLLNEVMTLVEGRPEWNPVILIDDLNELVDPNFEVTLERLLIVRRTRKMSILVSGEITAIKQSYSPLIGTFRNAKKGLLLTPDVAVDGDIFSLPLPRSQVKWTAGRGYLVNGPDTVLIQLAHVRYPSMGEHQR